MERRGSENAKQSLHKDNLRRCEMQHETQALKRRLAWGVLLVAALLTFVTLAWPRGVQGAPPTPLTPEQMRLVAEKERARKEAGIVDLSTPEGVYVQPGEPVRQFIGTIRVEKAKLLADMEAAWAADKGTLDLLERSGGSKAVQRMREEFEKQRREVEALPDGPISLDIPSVEVGRHSISFSKFTYSGSQQKDPINVVFYRVGKAWDVNYDMRNWTRLRWQSTGCGTSQRVYIWDAQHTGGWDGWRDMQYQLEREQGAFCGTPRYHVRLFGSFVRDSHSPGFGWWTVAGAHHDNWFHTCPDGWENAESTVLNSFQNANGSPLWFVGVRWQADLGNGGNYQCAYNDGWARFIELLY